MSEQVDGNDTLSDEEIRERRLEILENESLVQLFSSPANIRFLVVLIDSAEDLTASALARQAGVSRSAWYDNRDLLLDLNLVEVTRESAGATHYALADSEQAKQVIRLYDALRL